MKEDSVRKAFKRARNWLQDHDYTREYDGKAWLIDEPDRQPIQRTCPILSAPHADGQTRTKDQGQAITNCSFELLKDAFAQIRAFALLLRINKSPQRVLM